MEAFEKLLQDGWRVDISYDQHYRRCRVRLVNPFSTEQVELYDEHFIPAFTDAWLEALQLSKEVRDDFTV